MGTPGLFVATDISHFEAAEPEVYAPDVRVNGRCFRRLDPPFYAWLRHKMTIAKKALDARRLSPASFEELRARFNEVHAWAVAHLGDAALVGAVKALDPASYAPPRIVEDGPSGPVAAAAPARFAFPATGEWRFTEPVSPEAVAKVDKIRDEALALGWSEARLYQNRGQIRFPCGQEYGLVCFLGDDATIAAVSREAITIQGRHGHALRFYNADVKQPWCRNVEASAPTEAVPSR
jgi:hypothetical protein